MAVIKIIESTVTLCLLAGCGAAEVYIQPAASPADNAHGTLAIARAAQNGAQVVALPVTRLSVQPASAMSTRMPAHAVAAPPADNGGIAIAPGLPEPAVLTVTGRDGNQYRIAVTPAETGSSQDIFRATPRNDFTSRNMLRIMRFGNTDIPSVVENEFTDLTVLRIQQAGQVAAAVASVTPAVVAPPVTATPPRRAACPSGRTLTAFSVTIQNLMPKGDFLPVPGQDSCFEYQLRAVQDNGAADTVLRTEFRRLFVEGNQAARIWPVPACRDVTLSVRSLEGAEIIATPLRVADPSLLRLMPLPQKGKIRFDPVCGANLTDEPSDAWKIRTAVVEELAKQIKTGMNGWE